MRAFLATSFLAVLLVFGGGCRFLSGDEEDDPFYFDITYEDVETEGMGNATLEDGTLIIRGEYLRPDSSKRYVELTLPEFEGKQSYVLSRTAGIYGAVDEDESVRYGYSSGRPEDSVRIDGYDADDGVLLGAFFFYGTAYRNFDDIEAFFPFRVAGRFRTTVERE